MTTKVKQFLPQYSCGQRRLEQNQNYHSRLWDLGFASTLKTSGEKPLPDPFNHRGKEKKLSARCKLITNILILRNERDTNFGLLCWGKIVHLPFLKIPLHSPFQTSPSAPQWTPLSRDWISSERGFPGAAGGPRALGQWGSPLSVQRMEAALSASLPLRCSRAQILQLPRTALVLELWRCELQVQASYHRAVLPNSQQGTDFVLLLCLLSGTVLDRNYRAVWPGIPPIFLSKSPNGDPALQCHAAKLAICKVFQRALLSLVPSHLYILPVTLLVGEPGWL